jgi:hypothetical protein
MTAARALPPRLCRLGTLLVVAVLATALSSALPAVANPAADGGTPMPAARPDGGKPMPLAAPSQRSAAAVNQQVTEILKANPGSRRISATSVLLEPGVVMTVPGPVAAGATMTVPTLDGRQLTVSASDSSCAYTYLCVWQHIYRNVDRPGAKLAFYFCRSEDLGRYYISAGNSWRDDISSIWNNQSGGAVSSFYDNKGIGRVLVGRLSAGNYLQDLTRDRAADGGNWNDRIDRIVVC